MGGDHIQYIRVAFGRVVKSWRINKRNRASIQPECLRAFHFIGTGFQSSTHK
jgi:hypothetical protein